MNDTRLRSIFRQLFKVIRETRSRQDNLLRLYLEVLEEQRKLKARLDEFLRPADPKRPVN